MMIILCLISIAIIFVNVIYEDYLEEMIFVPILCLGGKLIAIGFLINQLIICGTIDKRIEIYQNYNQKIEQKVEIAVKQYMEHENMTFTDLKSESYITLVSLYPDLKSDELIKEEIELYESNNKNILELEEKKLNEKIYKFWLYFGK